MKRGLRGIGLILGLGLSGCSTPPAPESSDRSLFTIERTTVRRGFDGSTCWVHPRAGVSVGWFQDRVVMTLQRLDVSGSDLFGGLHQLASTDNGATWRGPEPLARFARRSFHPGLRIPGAERARELLQPGDQTVVSDFWPKWHRASGRLLGTGHTVWYRDGHILTERPRDVAYAVFEPWTRSWSPWRTLDLPALERFKNAGAGSVQRVDLPNGDILLPVYFRAPAEKAYRVTVLRCRFDGKTLHYVEHGDELGVPEGRGLFEPSLAAYRGRYFLTLRNDMRGYVAVSEDGLRFSTPVPWVFDDGAPLGNYNTQQHWVVHSEALFLVYTRRGADNDHVFRHRAPLFIAEVDPDTLRVKRDTEQILVPERGARLGNFGVTAVSPSETWVTVAEWMQPAGVEKHGSDNRVIAARLKWTRPNRAYDER